MLLRLRRAHSAAVRARLCRRAGHPRPRLGRLRSSAPPRVESDASVFTATVLGAELYYVLWFFFVFCFLGVIVELIFGLAQEGVIESKLGLLYLPFSPIYGLGGVSLSVFLLPYFREPVLMFFMGILVGTVLEFVASLVMEKVFKAVFWDYSDLPLNIQGRVCLQYSIYWGLLSLLLLYVIDDWVLAFVELIPRGAGEVALGVICVLTALSVVLTLAAFVRIRQKLAALQDGGSRDAIPASGWGRLVDRLAPDTVIINTFPRMSLVADYSSRTGIEPRSLKIDRRPASPAGTRPRISDRVVGDGRPSA